MIKRAVAITGWMQPVALRWLARQAKECERIIEVGVYQGRTTRTLLDNSTAHIWCIDTWTASRKHLKKTFMENVADALPRITVMHMPSAEAVKLLEKSHGQVFDMVFIDGSHEYKGARSDILEYRKLVKPGGLLCGHDYSPAAWPGVVQAVNELVPDAQFGPGSIWRAK